MEQAGEYNINILQGYDLDLTLSFEDVNGPLDLAGCTARLQVRKKRQSSSSLLFELTTENGGITLGGSPNVRLFKSAAQTAELSFLDAFYTFDLIDSEATPQPWLVGRVFLKRGGE